VSGAGGRPWRSFAAIALLSATTIVFEIAATRILSVVHGYHWAFLCISLAMLGLGAPGVWFSLSRRPSRFLPALLLLAAILVPASVVLVFKVSPIIPAYGMFFTMACLLLPLLCLGGGVCLLLLEARGRAVGRMYGFDLLGAFVGALAVVPLLRTLPTPVLVAALGLLPIAAHACRLGRVTATSGAIAGAIVALLAWGAPLHLERNKAYSETGARKPLLEIWTPMARLTFFDRPFFLEADKQRVGFGWGLGFRARAEPAEQCWIEQDGCAGTPIPRFTGDLGRLGYLFDDVTSLGLQLRPPGDVAVIGAGGGRDVLSALAARAEHVDAVELNDQLVSTLATRFRDFSGDVYHRPRVHAALTEGRSFLTGSARRYGLIQISLIDSWAATAAGAFSLSENNLYTVEAYRLYFNRLAPDGLVSTSRWLHGEFWIEVPRLFLLVMQALREEGVARPEAHIAVARAGWVGTLLLSKRPFTRGEIGRLRHLCAERGFWLLFPMMPESRTPPLLAKIFATGSSAVGEPGIRIDPPTDDRPFFFQVLPPFSRVDHATAARFGINGNAIYVLQLLMIVMAGLTVVLFFLPFVLGRWFRREEGLARGSLYFCSIGLAFMLVEVPWLQRFFLYLGHPSYATTVVLACLLLGAALGSISSAGLGLARLQRFGALLPALLVALDFALAPLFGATIGLPLELRFLITALVLVPVAFLMGTFFPLGMVRFGDAHKAWFWAVNGAAGVLASVLGLALSMEIGFLRVALLGAGCYVVSTVLLLGRPAGDAPASPPPR
jgi:hypothetical protein